MDNNKIAIYIVSHKKVNLPDMPGYYRIQVNAEKNDSWNGWLHDNEGDNISVKNNCYSELTALYALWKNNQSEVKGLVHYRRYFVQSSETSFASVYNGTGTYKALKKKYLTQDQILRDLQDYDMILPSPKCVYPLTAYEDLKTNCYKKDILTFIEIVKEKFPKAFPYLMDTLESLCASYCNMMIAGKSLFDDYCSWMFSILSEVEKHTDVSSYDVQRKRLYGYLSEILLNVYVKMRHLKCRYYNMVMITEQNRAEEMKRKVKTLLKSSGIVTTPKIRLCKKRCKILIGGFNYDVERKEIYSGNHFNLATRMKDYGFIHIQELPLKRTELKCLTAEMSYLNDGKRIKLYNFYTEDLLEEEEEADRTAIKYADSLDNIIHEIDQYNQISIYRLYLPFFSKLYTGKMYHDVLIL